MSNNKQSSVEWYIIERHTIEIQSRLGLISPIEYDAKLIKIEEQAKAMHHKEVVDFVEDWYCNGPLLGGGVDVKNTIEQHFNNTYGGGDK